ncbi:hypothetical protein ACM1RC_26135 [Paenibacillus azoreducens]|uniref:hypothetical protein n=1 Tax=Paenibacillus azoreducens TaxID=116718 RepID=UPI0039F56C9D
MFKVNKGIVKHEGAYHSKGSFFDGNEEVLKPLLAAKIVSREDPEAQREGIVLQEDPEIMPEEHNDYLPTIEEFSKMTAHDQKALLAELEIEAATNEKERLKQYSEYYEAAPDEL